MADFLSFKIKNTKKDAKNKIKKEFNKSLNRERLLNRYYAFALFNSPEKLPDIINLINFEIGYQKAVKDLSGNILKIV